MITCFFKYRHVFGVSATLREEGGDGVVAGEGGGANVGAEGVDCADDIEALNRTRGTPGVAGGELHSVGRE